MLRSACEFYVCLRVFSRILMNNPWEYRAFVSMKSRVNASNAARLWIFFHIAVAPIELGTIWIIIWKELGEPRCLRDQSETSIWIIFGIDAIGEEQSIAESSLRLSRRENSRWDKSDTDCAGLELALRGFSTASSSFVVRDVEELPSPYSFGSCRSEVGRFSRNL